ncbi:hypothetical protein BGW39_011767 [Mortierella sp. 14UC]|nr:hypothetical protein BGW39_011767 [Mortierella sp. 14UC]
MLCQCPCLEKLTVWRYLVLGKIDATAVCKACPKLREIHLNSTQELNNEQEDNEWPLRVMTGLPENVVETLRLYMDEHRLDERLVQASVAQHSTSLRRVYLESNRAGKATRNILATCEVLEELSVDTSIHLCDIITAGPWAISSLLRLSLYIKIGLPSAFLPRPPYYKPYYLQTPPIAAPPEEELRVLDRLKNLYLQIGRQTMLRQLKLHIEEEVDDSGDDDDCLMDGDEEDSVDRFSKSFPGMLSLPDAEAGRPGFLDLFAGLSKLESLEGHMSMMSRRTESQWERRKWIGYWHIGLV